MQMEDPVSDEYEGVDKIKLSGEGVSVESYSKAEVLKIALFQSLKLWNKSMSKINAKSIER